MEDMKEIYCNRLEEKQTIFVSKPFYFKNMHVKYNLNPYVKPGNIFFSGSYQLLTDIHRIPGLISGPFVSYASILKP